MVVILVLFTFAAFLIADYLVARRRESLAKRALRVAVQPAERPEAAPVWVAGYKLPEALHYHRGHTWARVLDYQTVQVGLDDFAKGLFGEADAIEMPAPGQPVRQGDASFAIGLGDRIAQFVSPVEGEVVEVNRALLENPELAAKDPYGLGWVMKVRVDDLRINLRNLLSGSFARKWIEHSREMLQLRLMALSGSVIQDGGEPVSDFIRHLPEKEWEHLLEEFLLN